MERLAKGETVSFRPHGNSMVPIIRSGQLVTLAPVTDPSSVSVGDAVFCRVNGRLMLHKVTALRDGRAQISNNHGHVNGWTGLEKVYGRVVSVAP